VPVVFSRGQEEMWLTMSKPLARSSSITGETPVTRGCRPSES